MGRSTLITAAPRAPSCMVQSGRDSTRVRSTTRNPSSGRMRFWPRFAAKQTGKQIGVYGDVHATFPGDGRRFNSKNALNKATETVCMSNNGKRVAWVTGGGSGIGEAGAEALAADGWMVVVSGRRKDALDVVVAEITRSGGQAEALALDVSKAADVNKSAEQILGRHGRIDLLVNSAGINVPKRSWADMELEGWNSLVEINLNGVL